MPSAIFATPSSRTVASPRRAFLPSSSSASAACRRCDRAGSRAPASGGQVSRSRPSRSRGRPEKIASLTSREVRVSFDVARAAAGFRAPGRIGFNTRNRVAACAPPDHIAIERITVDQRGPDPSPLPGRRPPGRPIRPHRVVRRIICAGGGDASASPAPADIRRKAPGSEKWRAPVQGSRRRRSGRVVFFGVCVVVFFGAAVLVRGGGADADGELRSVVFPVFARS